MEQTSRNRRDGAHNITAGGMMNWDATAAMEQAALSAAQAGNEGMRQTMDKGLRTALWVLSSLAVLWTVIAMVGMLGMVGMMSGSSAMMGHPGGMMTGMMVQTGLTWVVMLGLDVVFAYLLISKGARRTGGDRA
jgi:hypothetical protein